MADLVKVKPPWTTMGDPDDAPAPTGPSLLEPEYAPAYHAYAAAPTPANASALLTAVHPIINEAARSYAGGEAGSPTVLANAKRLTLEAAGRYDPNRAKLRTHLLSHLRGLRRQVARSSAGVYAPEQWRLDAQRLSGHLPDLRDQLGREPSDAELSDHTGLSMERIRKARSVPGTLSSSQAGDAMAVDKRDPEAYRMWVEAIYHDSSPIDQVILENSLGLFGKPIKSGGEVAKMINRTGGSVAQRKARLQQQLDMYETFLGKSENQQRG